MKRNTLFFTGIVSVFIFVAIGIGLATTAEAEYPFCAHAHDTHNIVTKQFGMTQEKCESNALQSCDAQINMTQASYGSLCDTYCDRKNTQLGLSAKSACTDEGAYSVNPTCHITNVEWTQMTTAQQPGVYQKVPAYRCTAEATMQLDCYCVPPGLWEPPLQQ